MADAKSTPDNSRRTILELNYGGGEGALPMGAVYTTTEPGETAFEAEVFKTGEVLHASSLDEIRQMLQSKVRPGTEQ